MMNLRVGIPCAMACVTLLTKTNGLFLTLMVGNLSQQRTRSIVKSWPILGPLR